MSNESIIKTMSLTFLIIAMFVFSYLFYLRGEGTIPLALLIVGIILSFIMVISAIRCNKR